MATPDPSNRGRDGRGRFARTVDTAERDAEAARLKTSGLTYDQIAQRLGFAERGAAQRATQRALRATVAEPAAELRTLELARLDVALAEAMAILRREHVASSAGKVVLDPVTGEPVRDDSPRLGAIDRIVKISERRCRLLGLDAPSTHRIITLDAVEAEIDRLAAELGMRAEADR